tara:strand:- start:312 stop:515 length:204 start_codon:yes stop_codon:yes gene_type:complete
MPIRRKSSIDKKNYERFGQRLLFGYDNLSFKTVNLPKKQRLINLSKEFSIKRIVQKKPILLSIIKLN